MATLVSLQVAFLVALVTDGLTDHHHHSAGSSHLDTTSHPDNHSPMADTDNSSTGDRHGASTTGNYATMAESNNMEDSHHQPIQSHDSIDRNDTTKTYYRNVQAGLQCFHCHGPYPHCGRKQLAEDDPIKTCETGQSCILGRKAEEPDTFVYFRDCLHETCGLEMEELYCMRIGMNVTCQRCCAGNNCNADAFNSATVTTTMSSPLLLCLLSALLVVSLLGEVVPFTREGLTC